MRQLIEYNIDGRETRVDLNATKKRMEYNNEYDSTLDVYDECLKRAVEKTFGIGKCFISDNSGIEGRGQIWQNSPQGGYDSVTGVIYVNDNFFDVF